MSSHLQIVIDLVNKSFNKNKQTNKFTHYRELCSIWKCHRAAKYWSGKDVASKKAACYSLRKKAFSKKTCLVEQRTTLAHSLTARSPQSTEPPCLAQETAPLNFCITVSNRLWVSLKARHWHHTVVMHRGATRAYWCLVRLLETQKFQLEVKSLEYRCLNPYWTQWSFTQCSQEFGSA